MQSVNQSATNYTNGSITEKETKTFDLGEQSGLYFLPKSFSFSQKLDASKVQSAFTKDNTKLKGNPYVLEFKEPRQGSKGRGLIVYKNYVNGVPKQYGIVNNRDSGVKLSISQVDSIKELAKESVSVAMSDDDLANDK
tara:strand:- start:89 stop:502 length:414 start_codon:yes stop_codon:yes gene_type:complete